MQSQPFFIIGHPRSGTTLLRMILCAHSRIFIPDETGFIPFLHTDERKRLTTNEIQKVLKRIGSLNIYWQDMIQPADIAEVFPSRPNLAAVLDKLYQMKAAPFHASRWGDKTPLYIQYIPDILRLFPEAMFIHVIRDGRDAALSARQKWGYSSPYLNLYYLLRNWVRNIRVGRFHGSYLGERQYLEIRYEALVSNPEVVARNVCSFLGEDFESVLLDHTAIARQLGPGHDDHAQAMKPIFHDSVSRWRRELTSFEIKLADRLAGETLAELGYHRPVVEPMTPSEQLRYIGLATKFIFFDRLRALLYRTGWLTLNRTMRRQPTDARDKSL
jgi:hypothetical protein